MYDHIGIKVGNLDASVRFYGAALAPLGYVLGARAHARACVRARRAAAGWFQPVRGAKREGARVVSRARAHTQNKTSDRGGPKAAGKHNGKRTTPRTPCRSAS